MNVGTGYFPAVPPNLTHYSASSQCIHQNRLFSCSGYADPLLRQAITVLHTPHKRFRSPSEAHSALRSLLHSHQRQLSEREVLTAYLHFLIGLVLFYTIFSALSILKNKKLLFFWINSPCFWYHIIKIQLAFMVIYDIIDAARVPHSLATALPERTSKIP